MSAEMSQMLLQIGMWVVVFGVFYFLLIKPQKKKDKELKDMRDNLQVGDKVTTIGGIIGEIATVKENEVVLSVGPNKNKVPFEKWAISTLNK